MGEVAEAPVCITQHPGFQAVCRNRWVLQTAWYQYKQQYSQSYEGPQHKLNRHVAYRQLVRWCWGVAWQRNESLFHHVQCVALEHTFLLWDLKMTSSSRVFIFQMNKKQQVHMVTQKGCTLCAWTVCFQFDFVLGKNNIYHRDIYRHLKSFLLCEQII